MKKKEKNKTFKGRMEMKGRREVKKLSLKSITSYKAKKMKKMKKKH